MGMTPDDFFETFVQGNYQDYLHHPGSVRHAFNAAVAASHMADHYHEYERVHNPAYPYGTERDATSVMQAANAQTHGAFNYLRSIANAYKHLYLRSTHADVSSAGAIYSLSSLDSVDDIAEIVGEEEEEKSGSVRFTDKAGIEHEFKLVLDAVMKHWEDLMGAQVCCEVTAESNTPGEIKLASEKHHSVADSNRTSDRETQRAPKTTPSFGKLIWNMFVVVVMLIAAWVLINMAIAFLTV